MAAVKMSVLHLHLSEGAYQLPTAALPSLNRGVRHYSSTDVAAIINYATDRSIRVVPEVDVSPAALLPAALATSLYAVCTPATDSLLLYCIELTVPYCMYQQHFGVRSGGFFS